MRTLLVWCHRWLGLSAGLVLLIMGLTGALLSFEQEIVHALNDSRVQPPAGAVPLPADVLRARLQRAVPPARPLVDFRVPTKPDEAGRAWFGSGIDTRVRFFDPYTGVSWPDSGVGWAMLVIQEIHTNLALAAEGKFVTGLCTLALVVLVLTGLIRRAPRRLVDLKGWFFWRWGFRGRARVWQWHALLGTWLALPVLLAALTGLTGSYDWYREGIRNWLPGEERAPVSVPVSAGPLRADRVAAGFAAHLPQGQGYRWVEPQAGEAVRVTYLEPRVPFSSAHSELLLEPSTGRVLDSAIYSELSLRERYMYIAYALHVGSFFGLFGRIIMMLASVGLIGFAATGVYLYLQAWRPRRGGPGADPDADTLVLYASQSGTAARQAELTAAWLQEQGHRIRLTTMQNIRPATLAQFRRLIVVNATYGDGGPPESARRFAAELAHRPLPLSGIETAILSFGDSTHQHFCAFGRFLRARFEASGARTVAVGEVDRGDPQVLAAWWRELADYLQLQPPAAIVPPWTHVTVQASVLVNPQDPERALWRVRLNWQPKGVQPGDLVEVQPKVDPAAMAISLRQAEWDPEAVLALPEGGTTLLRALTEHREWRAPPSGSAPQAWIERLPRMTPRRYSVANAPGQEICLWVRRVPWGLCSNYLGALRVGDWLQVRHLPHPGFRLPRHVSPLVLISNGTGLAPFLSFLESGYEGMVWWLHGERQPPDAETALRLTAWGERGSISCLDWVVSTADPQQPYVQHRLRTKREQLRAWWAKGAHFYICGGANTLWPGVRAVLDEVIGTDEVEQLFAAGRCHLDIY
ncbi:PepSY domain-containing protein [Nitrococcus mobilis]|uniref:Iron-uptake factor n=1 Tax=Nitrococcus mobilis Nb-231 TaxID=314278 RepID=A4BRG7_9GAMM|nr:PepSY domain-containing protein [Nitrococcus mobilis]EAR21789.1 iron-uptake factor [Nitrococcus mobilis Nb-231]